LFKRNLKPILDEDSNRKRTVSIEEKVEVEKD